MCMDVAVCVGISLSACHICFPSLIGDNSPLHLFPFLGPEPALRGRLLSHQLSFCDLHPCKWWPSPLALSSLPPAAGLSFTPDKGGPQALKGHQRHVAKGGKQGGALHTGPFLPLFPYRTSLQLSGSSRDPHIHSLLHTHTLPPLQTAFFAIRSVATREPCSIGEAGGMVGGDVPLPRPVQAHPPPHLYNPPQLEAALQRPLGLGLSLRG